jgi:hypothetical protein
LSVARCRVRIGRIDHQPAPPPGGGATEGDRTMGTPDEIRAAIANGREDFRAALESARSKWETKPATAPEGEEPWTPRQIAEHVAFSDVRIASGICITCGYPGKDAVRGAYATVDEAAAGCEEAAKWADGRLKYITDTDIVKTNERGMTVAALMEIMAKHLHDHAAQIRAV